MEGGMAVSVSIIKASFSMAGCSSSSSRFLSAKAFSSFLNFRNYLYQVSSEVIFFQFYIFRNTGFVASKSSI